MRAVTIRGGRVVVAEHPDPEPAAGDILVRVRAAGLNGADMMQLRGDYPAPPGAPADIPGLEFAGAVVVCGAGVQRFEPGDRVMGIVAGGGQAELVAVSERHAMPIPDELDWEAAGGVPEAFTTAHDALFAQLGLGMGERLLVSGAAGGVGLAAVQLATMAGARVTATVRDEDLRRRVETLGIRAIALDEFADRGPYDAILELVGAPNMPANLDALADCGRISVIGVSAGSVFELDLSVLMARRGRIHASALRSRSLEDKAHAARLVERSVLPGFASGDLSVPVAATFPLGEAAAAYGRFAAGGKFGKVVLTF